MRTIVSADGTRKYVERDPEEKFTKNGRSQTVLEWAIETGLSMKEVMKIHWDKPEKPVVRPKIYRVRYQIFHREYAEIRFRDVPGAELQKFLYDHAFSRVVSEREV